MSKHDSIGELLGSADHAQVSNTQPSMTKSSSLPNPTSAHSHSVPSSLSQETMGSSNRAVTTHAETQSLRSDASSSSVSGSAIGSQDDGSVSSDSIGVTNQESNGKEKKKKFSLFKRHKVWNDYLGDFALLSHFYILLLSVFLYLTCCVSWFFCSKSASLF